MKKLTSAKSSFPKRTQRIQNNMGLYTDRPILSGYKIMSLVGDKEIPGSAAVSETRGPCMRLHAKGSVCPVITTEP